MRGYTDGLQKELAKQSNDKGLDYTDIAVVDKEDGDAIVDALTNHFDNYDSTLEGEDVALVVRSLQDDGYYSLDDGGELELDDNGRLGYREDCYIVIDNLAQGGFLLHCDTNKEVRGARIGVAGEHVGMVNIWIDTYKGVVEGWGDTLKLSDYDCDSINEALEDMY